MHSALSKCCMWCKKDGTDGFMIDHEKDVMTDSEINTFCTNSTNLLHDEFSCFFKVYVWMCLLGMVDVHRLTSVFVGLRATFGLKMHYDWQGGRIYLQLESTWAGSTLGLCGTLNGNLRDDFL